jgi:iron-sulfur cluster insertion protein
MPDGSLERHDLNIQPFGLTKNAATQIAKLLLNEAESEDKFMRVAVEGGGCSGFQYIFNFDTQKNNDDHSFEKDGIFVVVDEISLELIKGGALDYVEELIGSYFQVVNPNASSSCGCGTSFSI